MAIHNGVLLLQLLKIRLVYEHGAAGAAAEGARENRID